MKIKLEDVQQYAPWAISVRVEAKPDFIPVRGNAMASGDAAYDKKVEDKILRRLSSGDIWAWASVEVRVTVMGYEGYAHLGCCCYGDKEDFIKSSGYYNNMVEQAFEECLVNMPEDAIETLAARIAKEKRKIKKCRLVIMKEGKCNV
jgi:hypothetical protein